mmetsp:Transcript_25903/g.54070  ORF Transcript_25903/g.54070 Transcript_25903/m.54070 type:complete len:245 (-) Transcript_25903:1194-1928(-)
MRASKEPCRFVWESFLLSGDDGSPIEGSPLTMSSTNLAAEAVRANCSSADSVLGISPLEASLAACANCPSEDPDLCIVSIAFSVSGLTSISGGVDDMDTLCGGGIGCGAGTIPVGGAAIATGVVAAGILLAETAALPLALFILSANFPFGLYVDGGRNHGGVGGRLLLSSSGISSLTTLLTPPPTLLTMLKVVWLEDGTTFVIMEPVPMPMAMVVDTPGDLTRFVCATRSKNLRSNSLNSTRIL